MPSQYDIIRTRRSEKIKAKLDIYKLLDDSYRGGFAYKNGGHLKKYPREWTEIYKTRQDRAIYFNYIQPIADILSGFLFKNDISRTLPPDLEYLAENVSKDKGVDSFMHGIAITSLLYTVGILVDSPSFDPNQYLSEAARRDANLNPYCCVYYPYQIRDFATDEDGKLLWVLLDDSRCEKEDPFREEKKRTIYRLWTAAMSQDFEIIVSKDKAGGFDVIPGEPRAHSVGYVPFHFVNWRDIEDDQVSDSPMEDIAILSQQIYNVLSLLDEQLHTGTFSTLFFPVNKIGDIPEQYTKAGIYDIPLVEAPAGMPEYKKPGLDTIEPFMSAVKFYIYEIFRKIGMDVDRDKSYVQSGAAMGKEFEKTEALLRYGAEAMSEAEEFIFRTMARWLKKNADDSIEIEYKKNFQSDDLDLRLKRLYDVFNLGLRPLKELALKEIIQAVLPKADAETLSKETEGTAPEFPLSGGAAADALQMARTTFAKTQSEVNQNG